MWKDTLERTDPTSPKARRGSSSFSFSEGVHAASKLVCGSWTASQRSIGIGGSNPDATFSLDLPHTF
jgi:hypothetical protein